MPLNRKDLAKALFDDVGIPEQQAKEAVNALFDKIREHLIQGGEVRINQFGSFRLSLRNARTVRDWRTGEPMEKPASQTVQFRPSQGLLDVINNLGKGE